MIKICKIPFHFLTGFLLILLLTDCTSTTQFDTAGMTFSKDPLVGKVIWNDLITEDLESARRFYGALFGWTFQNSSRKPGRYMVARAGDVYVAGFVSVDPRPDGAGLSRWLPYISVGDVDTAVSRARQSGGDVVVEPQDVDLGRAAVIVDPEGAVIGLAQSSIGDPDDRTTGPAVGRVVLTELLANDPRAEASFYQNIIGYDSRTIDRRGGQYTQLVAQGKMRAGVFRNPSKEAKPRWITFFGVADPAAAAARAEALGGTVVIPVSPEIREGTMAVVADPSGALLGFQKLSEN